MLKHYWTHNRKAWNVSTFLDCSVWQSFLHGFEILIMLPLDDFVGQERLDSNREVGVWAIGGFVHLIIRGLPHPTEEWCSVWFWAMHFDQSWHRHFDRTVLMSLLHTCRGELLKRLLCWILPDDLFFLSTCRWCIQTFLGEGSSSFWPNNQPDWLIIRLVLLHHVLKSYFVARYDGICTVLFHFVWKEDPKRLNLIDSCVCEDLTSTLWSC